MDMSAVAEVAVGAKRQRNQPRRNDAAEFEEGPGKGAATVERTPRSD